MRHPSGNQINEVLEVFQPDWVQTDAADFNQFHLPPGCQALPVYRNGALPTSANQPPRLLFEGAESGTGLTADWDEARTLARSSELILAGGLNSANVATAITIVGPWGVDVSSGVEVERGLKDPALIAQFIAAVRTTENAHETG
jgi:phosphoribosylanthranilate isomerase